MRKKKKKKKKIFFGTYPLEYVLQRDNLEEIVEGYPVLVASSSLDHVGGSARFSAWFPPERPAVLVASAPDGNDDDDDEVSGRYFISLRNLNQFEMKKRRRGDAREVPDPPGTARVAPVPRPGKPGRLERRRPAQSNPPSPTRRV